MLPGPPPRSRVRRPHGTDKRQSSTTAALRPALASSIHYPPPALFSRHTARTSADLPPSARRSSTMRRDSEASTSCRIERKRAHDREAQRASRAKTKQYIAHLEKTVADLTESSGDSRANYLAQHASQQSQEIDKLQGLVNKIRSLVQDASKSEASSVKGEGSTSTNATEPLPTDAFSALNWDTASEDQWMMEASKPLDMDVPPQPPQPPQPQPAMPMRRITETSRNLVVLGINLFCENNDDTTYFQRLNELIEKIERTPDNLSTPEEDMDILIRAIVSGWDAAERVHHFDIVWRFLRAFDEGLWYRAAPIERFAHFWNMRSTMLHKIRPKNQPQRKVASFMSSTIGQRSAGHPSVVDYFGWPLVRKYLLTSGIANCSGRAAIAFTESFRFDWPWETRDVYKINRATGVYSFSDEFLKAFDDITSFQLLPNQLIPFEIHTPPKTSPQAEFAHTDDRSSVDDEYTYQTLGFESVSPHGQSIPAQQVDTSAEDWMNTLAAMHEAGRHAMHNAIPSFTVAHGANMSQWPAV
ncbi:hypothetical protein CERZMDRAFT_86790 [Cercospora zeae-maydis SCOH1-5]|uniref:BZIP domain-containing protein n=1 Tax=Cercospora zeae-maydis SCOH1-5 TaxID=717836 RepID=A0A6A6F4R3_9PEZI|nr:hypothetical protein CERZMDRAFT_86790 [Cercospora zeae-maydis SCOH1-5]